MSLKNAQRGFTMIELIVVIVILGVLAAIAVPRMTNLQRDARVAKLNAARGAVQSAATMVYGSAMARQGQVQPVCPATGTTPTTVSATTGNGQICTQNGIIPVTRLYPNANNQGIVLAAGLVQLNGAPTNGQINTALAAEGYQVQGAGGGTLRISVTGGTAAANCSFTYALPATLGQAPTISAINSAGC